MSGILFKYGSCVLDSNKKFQQNAQVSFKWDRRLTRSEFGSEVQKWMWRFCVPASSGKVLDISFNEIPCLSGLTVYQNPTDTNKPQLLINT